jgi:hypothetical protein
MVRITRMADGNAHRPAKRGPKAAERRLKNPTKPRRHASKKASKKAFKRSTDTIKKKNAEMSLEEELFFLWRDTYDAHQRRG